MVAAGRRVEVLVISTFMGGGCTLSCWEGAMSNLCPVCCRAYFSLWFLNWIKADSSVKAAIPMISKAWWAENIFFPVHPVLSSSSCHGNPLLNMRGLWWSLLLVDGSFQHSMKLASGSLSPSPTWRIIPSQLVNRLQPPCMSHLKGNNPTSGAY